MANIKITASTGGATTTEAFDVDTLVVNGQPPKDDFTITVDEDGVTIDSGTVIIRDLEDAAFVLDCLTSAVKRAKPAKTETAAKKTPEKPAAKPKAPSRRK